MSGYRPDYTRAEQQEIVNYIIKSGDLHSLRGNRFWKEMEESGKFKRTWQSLKQHFKKFIINNIHLYSMTEEDRHKLKAAYKSTELASKDIPKESIGVYNVEL